MLQPDNTGYTPSYQQQAKPAAPHLPARPNPSKIGTGAFSPRQGTGAPAWDVTAAEKANADDFFSKLDAQRLGYIEGDIVVPFMRESNLPDEDLAQIWYVDVIFLYHIYLTWFFAQGSRGYQRRRSSYPRWFRRRDVPHPEETQRRRDSLCPSLVVNPSVHALHERSVTFLSRSASARACP